MKIGRNRIFVALVIIVALGLLFLRDPFSGQNKNKSESATVQKGDLAEKTTISGKIDADERVVLQFQTSGLLSWVGVKKGDQVKKYQGIAALDKRSVKKTLEKYLNTYLKTRWDFEQTHENYKNTVITDTVKRILEKSQFDLNSSVLDVEIQDLTVQFSNLWTPIEGIVVRADSPYAGVNITPTQAQFEIINPKTVYFSASADQTEVTQLKEGMDGQLVLDSYPDKELKGKIENISFTPKAGEGSTVYEVKFRPEKGNDDYRYRIGMAGDVTFVTNRAEDALYIPSKFIKSEGEKKYVNIKKNGRKEKAYIQTDLETDDYTQITLGLSEGEAVYE